MALVETAYDVLDRAQQREGVGATIGAAVLTLECGMKALLRTYTELDLAIQRQD